MKKMVFVIVLIWCFKTINGQNPKKLIGPLIDFSPNEKAYLFGDNVKFKTNPTVDAKVIEYLKIGSEIKILEKKNETYIFNGVVWPWYKVEYKNKVGYILGGLISYNKKTILNDTYLVSYKQKKGIYTAIVRVLNNRGKYFEERVLFGTNEYFSLKVFGNQGVDSVKSMARLDFGKEGCETCQSDGYYLFFNKKSLQMALQFNSYDDVVSWVSEKIIFPNDKGGKKGKILYSREEGKLLEATINRKKIKKEAGEFIWDGKFITLK